MRTFFEHLGVDIVIVRENTEDLYAGVEFQAGKEETARLIEFINSLPADRKIKSPGGPDRHFHQAESVLPGTERIVRCALITPARTAARNNGQCTRRTS